MSTRYRWFDFIAEFAKGKKAIAIKNVSPTERYFPDHFPKMPVVPGMLQLEGLLHVGRWLVDASNDFHSTAVLQSVKNVDFRRFVSPGDRLTLEAEIVSSGTDGATVKAKATVDGRKVAGVGEIVFALKPLSSAQAAREKDLFRLLSGEVPDEQDGVAFSRTGRPVSRHG